MGKKPRSSHIRSRLSRLKPTKRRLIQLYAALLFNANLKGFRNGRIYQGPVKNLCTPGLNCYSCPAASGACPLGALQNALADSGKTVPYYMVGILLLYGVLFGRWICGFLCPFGLIQELLHKIKTPKIPKNRFTRVLSYFKYVLLVFLVLILPLTYAGLDFPLPGFCKYICPAGTLEGAIGLLFHPENHDLFGMLGPLFTWKFVLLVIFLVGAVFIYRFFCRFFCPLGAIYGLFNRFSVIGIKLDRDACTHCGLCRGRCGMDIRTVGDHECIQCGECLDVCPTGAISFRGPKILLPPQAIGGEIPTKNPTLDASDQAAFREAEAARKKQTKRMRLSRIIVSVCMLALLAGTLYYFNFIDRPDVGQEEHTSPVEGNVPSLPPVGHDVGNLLPSLDLASINHGTESLNPGGFRGKITVINFWGTWCGPCVAELPYFDEAATAFRDRATIIAVHSDFKGETAASWVGERYPDTDILFCRDTSDGQSGAYYTACGGKGTFPMTLIADENGVILFVRQGSLSKDELFRAMEAALSGKSPESS